MRRARFEAGAACIHSCMQLSSLHGGRHADQRLRSVPTVACIRNNAAPMGCRSGRCGRRATRCWCCAAGPPHLQHLPAPLLISSRYTRLPQKNACGDSPALSPGAVHPLADPCKHRNPHIRRLACRSGAAWTRSAAGRSLRMGQAAMRLHTRQQTSPPSPCWAWTGMPSARGSSCSGAARAAAWRQPRMFTSTTGAGQCRSMQQVAVRRPCGVLDRTSMASAGACTACQPLLGRTNRFN